jgi:hypothetical protein
LLRKLHPSIQRGSHYRADLFWSGEQSQIILKRHPNTAALSAVQPRGPRGRASGPLVLANPCEGLTVKGGAVCRCAIAKTAHQLARRSLSSASDCHASSAGVVTLPSVPARCPWPAAIASRHSPLPPSGMTAEGPIWFDTHSASSDDRSKGGLCRFDNRLPDRGKCLMHSADERR